MYRTREYRRDIRNRKIARKKRICNNYGFEWYKHDGQYSKGKIHCSCKSCKYGRHYNLPTLRDEREKLRFNSELAEYNN